MMGYDNVWTFPMFRLHPQGRTCHTWGVPSQTRRSCVKLLGNTNLHHFMFDSFVRLWNHQCYYWEHIKVYQHKPGCRRHWHCEGYSQGVSSCKCQHEHCAGYPCLWRVSSPGCFGGHLNLLTPELPKIGMHFHTKAYLFNIKWAHQYRIIQIYQVNLIPPPEELINTNLSS